MKKGMAEEIRNLQIVKRNGQISLFDVYDIEDLLEVRPCIFDRIDHLVMSDDTWDDDSPAFDPEVA